MGPEGRRYVVSGEEKSARMICWVAVVIVEGFGRRAWPLSLLPSPAGDLSGGTRIGPGGLRVEGVREKVQGWWVW